MVEALAELYDNTTIVAISTPPGVGGIAVARLSGRDAIEIADKIWRGKRLSGVNTHTVHLGIVLDSKGDELDQCVVTVFIGPNSFTGQDTVEFAVHGSKFVQRELVASLVNAGATPARAGEFTRRALTAGKLSLTQAEAIADIIHSTSRAAHRLAVSQLKGNFAHNIDTLRQQLIDLVSLLELELDFSEEDVAFADRKQLKSIALNIKNQLERLLDTFRTGNAVKNGIPVAIIGKANVGKSSLLNALTQSDRAIVTDIAGTTRDTIEEIIEIGDYIFRFIDTAGLRHTDDPIEKIGIERSVKTAKEALIVLHVTDDKTDLQNWEMSTEPSFDPSQTVINILNKCDLIADKSSSNQNNTSYQDKNNHTEDFIRVSAKTGEGLDLLRQRLEEVANSQLHSAEQGADNEDIIITNQRHATSLAKAIKACDAAILALDTDHPTDLVAEDVRSVLDCLSELTGQITSTDILTTIFSRFCIGK
ncbi:MAG: tRNA uridine-5-carboxymethylaminomethyl(34) synthesis GTPase MnmE [Muribaculaceae bacterium]|nr:tRNA uridine-5-carboxymethylaminomethyl(34) synthesis GTPase MnmE [Muribaculaceae bacterium]